MNEIIQCILQRRSIRKYTSQPVSPEDLDWVLQCGLYAASGGNHQSARFTVLTNRADLDALSTLAREEFLKMPLVEGAYRSIAIRNARNRPTSYDFSFHAPVLVIVTAPVGWPNGMADSASCLQNMQVAAHALGLGACWVNQLHWLTENPAVRAHLEVFGIRPDEEICGCIAMGHPDGTRPAPAPRKEGRVTIFS